jgi:hypothetical protein
MRFRLRNLAVLALIAGLTACGAAGAEVQTQPATAPATHAASSRDDVHEIRRANAMRRAQFEKAVAYAAALGHNIDLANWARFRAQEAARHQRAAQHYVVHHTPAAQYGVGACGGDLPPCWIMMRESRGNIRAMNPSGAAGKWQIMPGTWNGYGGYSSAADAPEAVQDAKARTLAPCNWQPPNYCAG